jgi:hypothetical protein
MEAIDVTDEVEVCPFDMAMKLRTLFRTGGSMSVVRLQYVKISS